MNAVICGIYIALLFIQWNTGRALSVLKRIEERMNDE